MKTATGLAAAAFALVLAGCSAERSETVKKAATDAVDATKEKVAETMDKAAAMTPERRQEVADELRAKAEEIQSRLETLQKASVTATADAKASIGESVEQLRAWKHELFMQMDRLSKATADERAGLAKEADALLDEIDRWWKTRDDDADAE